MRVFALITVLILALISTTINAQNSDFIRTSKYYDLMEQYLNAKENEDVKAEKTLLYDVIDGFPEDPFPYYQLYRIYTSEGNLNSAHDILAKGLQKNKNEITLLYALLITQIKLGLNEDISITIAKAKKHDPQGMLFGSSLFTILYWNKDYEDIVRIIETKGFLTNESYASSAAYYMSMAYYGEKDYSSSTRYVDMAIDKIYVGGELPDLQTYYLQNTINYFYLDDYKRAEDSMINAMYFKIGYDNGDLNIRTREFETRRQEILTVDRKVVINVHMDFDKAIDCNNYARLLGEFTDEEKNILRIIYRRIFFE